MFINENLLQRLTSKFTWIEHIKEFSADIQIFDLDQNLSPVKLVYKDHPRDQHNLVLVYTGGLYVQVRLHGQHTNGDL